MDQAFFHFFTGLCCFYLPPLAILLVSSTFLKLIETILKAGPAMYNPNQFGVPQYQ